MMGGMLGASQVFGSVDLIVGLGSPSPVKANVVVRLHSVPVKDFGHVLEEGLALIGLSPEVYAIRIPTDDLAELDGKVEGFDEAVPVLLESQFLS